MHILLFQLLLSGRISGSTTVTGWSRGRTRSRTRRRRRSRCWGLSRGRCRSRGGRRSRSRRRRRRRRRSWGGRRSRGRRWRGTRIKALRRSGKPPTISTVMLAYPRLDTTSPRRGNYAERNISSRNKNTPRNRGARTMNTSGIPPSIRNKNLSRRRRRRRKMACRWHLCYFR